MSVEYGLALVPSESFGVRLQAEYREILIVEHCLKMITKIRIPSKMRIKLNNPNLGFHPTTVVYEIAT